LTARQTEAEFIRSQIADLRSRLCELEPYPTREQVKEAIRAQESGSTLKAYAYAHHLNRQALYRAVFARRTWLWRVKEFGPGPHRAGPEP
jgi:hypothetical protein